MTLPDTRSPGFTVVSLTEIASICGAASGCSAGTGLLRRGAVAGCTAAPGVGVMTGGLTRTGEGVGAAGVGVVEGGVPGRLTFGGSDGCAVLGACAAWKQLGSSSARANKLQQV